MESPPPAEVTKSRSSDPKEGTAAAALPLGTPLAEVVAAELAGTGHEAAAAVVGALDRSCQRIAQLLARANIVGVLGSQGTVNVQVRAIAWLCVFVFASACVRARCGVVWCVVSCCVVWCLCAPARMCVSIDDDCGDQLRKQNMTSPLMVCKQGLAVAHLEAP